MDLDKRFSLLFTHLSRFFWSRPSDGLPPHLAEDLLLQLGLNSAGCVRLGVCGNRFEPGTETFDVPPHQTELREWCRLPADRELYDSFRSDHPVVFTARSKQIQYLLSLLFPISLQCVSFLLYSEFDALQKLKVYIIHFIQPRLLGWNATSVSCSPDIRFNHHLKTDSSFFSFFLHPTITSRGNP